jgi:Flp pilus assembly protein CpaB
MARTIAGTAPGRTNRRFLIVAFMLAALSAALVYAVTARDSGGDGNRTSVGSTQVVVAKTAIKQRTTITAEMLDLSSVPTSSVIAGVFTSVNDAVGKVTKYPIEANQQVVGAAVVDTANPVANDALANLVPTNKRAMSISASQVTNAGGLILPGDYVDLVWVCCGDRPVISKTIIRNVQVVAIAQGIVASGPVAGPTGAEAPVAAETGEPDPEAQTMTLLFSPQEVQTVFLAGEFGKFRASLRGLGDAELPDSGQTLITDPTLLPVEALSALPDELKPEGYKPEGP